MLFMLLTAANIASPNSSDWSHSQYSVGLLTYVGVVAGVGGAGGSVYLSPGRNCGRLSPNCDAYTCSPCPCAFRFAAHTARRAVSFAFDIAGSNIAISTAITATTTS